MNDKNIPKDWKQVKLEEVRNMINKCLNRLYEKDSELFKRNGGRGISERGFVFRFAHYLQQEMEKEYHPGYFVDCDYNSTAVTGRNGKIARKSGKNIPNSVGEETKRFIDIIVHKRTVNREENLICFEVKKWNNYNRRAREKDINNLKQLTSAYYDYKYGFHLILGRNRNSVKCTVFEEGKEIKKGNC